MASWEEWVQDVGGSVIDKYSDAAYSQPYEIQRLKIEALGDAGYYTEGQPGVKASGTVGGISQGMLLLAGAALVALLLLKG